LMCVAYDAGREPEPDRHEAQDLARAGGMYQPLRSAAAQARTIHRMDVVDPERGLAATNSVR